MAQNPINLAVRFVLEIVGLGVFAWWGNRQGGLLLAVVVVVIAATMWGVFRVPGDAGHRGDALVAVPGWVRLLMEVAFFGAAVLILARTGHPVAALILGVVLVAHYAISYDRIAWLLRQ